MTVASVYEHCVYNIFKVTDSKLALFESAVLFTLS